MARCLISAEFSPTPPVKTRASMPSMAAAMAAIDPRSRCRKTSRASSARVSPAAAWARISRMSAVPASP